MIDVKAEFPDKLQVLFEPHRVKVLKGGRGGAKSWGIARALLLLGFGRTLRIVCAREIQKSIADSVHALLKDQIASMGLGEFYTVNESRIVGANGTEFIFAGLRHNITSIKSLEGADIVWVEEAQSVSGDSWDTLIPTIRKDPANIYAEPHPSEIWIGFNPQVETDPTYVRWVLNPPEFAVVVDINWRDNPWFPEVLRIEKDHLEKTDPKAYLHVWEGHPKSAVSGAIYEEELKQAQDSGRITKVSLDRTRPVDTFWDLGFNDSTAIWFAQSLADGSYRLIDYLESRGKTIEWYVIQLQQKGYLYGTDWIPHDGVDTIIHQKLAGVDRSRSIEQLMRAAGRNVRLAPKMHIMSGINAARTIFSQCWFDAEKCIEGLRCLRYYQWAPNSASGKEAATPLHDFASHAADAFRTLAVTIRQPVEQKEQKRRQNKPVSAWS